MRNHKEGREETPGQDGGWAPDQNAGSQGDKETIKAMVWTPLYRYFKIGQFVDIGVGRGENRSEDGTKAVPGSGKMAGEEPRAPINNSTPVQVGIMRNHKEGREETPGQDGGWAPDQNAGSQGDKETIKAMVWTPLYRYFKMGHFVDIGVGRGENRSEDGTKAVPGCGKKAGEAPRTPINGRQKPHLINENTQGASGVIDDKHPMMTPAGMGKQAQR
ncbi:uncharacterized protein LOC143998127 [Lithobates pipiens]